METGRRSAMGLLGGLALGGISGCCLTPAQRRDVLQPVPGPALPCLAGSGQRRADASAAPATLDVHAHFFNASDIDAAGYLAHSVAHTSPELERLLVAMQPVLRAVTDLASTAAEEYAFLQQVNALASPTAARALLDQRMAQRRQRIEQALAEAMQRHGVVAEYHAAHQALAQRRGRAYTAQPFNQSAIHAILEDTYLPSAAASRASGPALAGGTPDGIIRFVACMLHERWTNLVLYQRHWEPLGVVGVFGAMVNFDYTYCASRSSPRDQMYLMALISKMSGGYMLPLAAYNPLTDLQEQGASLQLLQEAVSDHGYVGVKIYPPMGFKPYGNNAQLDPLLLAMFSWCAQHKVPVMAHANDSMGYDSAADQASAPAGWLALAQAMPPQLPLRVNLGHMGGDGSGTSPTSWTSDYARLMQLPAGRHVYGDLGYWSGLRSCSDTACPALGRISAALAVFPQLGSRLMYGSDWFMMIKEDRWSAYLPELQAALARLPLDLQAVLRDNAMACFALNDSARREQLRQHLGRLPAWLG